MDRRCMILSLFVSVQVTEWEDSEVHKRLYAIRFGHLSNRDNVGDG